MSDFFEISFKHGGLVKIPLDNFDEIWGNMKFAVSLLTMKNPKPEIESKPRKKRASWRRK